MLPGRTVKTNEKKKSILTDLSVYPPTTEGWPRIHQMAEESGEELWVLICREWLTGQQPKQKERGGHSKGGQRHESCERVGQLPSVSRQFQQRGMRLWSLGGRRPCRSTHHRGRTHLSPLLPSDMSRSAFSKDKSWWKVGGSLQAGDQLGGYTIILWEMIRSGWMQAEASEVLTESTVAGD